MKNKKPKIRISIKKKYKEIMEDGNKSMSDISSDLNEEDFSWVEKEGNEGIKKLYTEFPFQEWSDFLKCDFSKENIIEGPEYQEKVCNIFENFIFKSEKFQKEEHNCNIFQNYLNKELKTLSIKKLQPDFIIINIRKENFLEIIEKNKCMFRKWKNFQIPEEFKYVTVFGEIKKNPKLIKTKKKKQLLNYVSFKNFMNRTQKLIYFVVLYVFDNSYLNFWNKTFFDTYDIIISYMPKLYKRKYLESFNYLCNKNEPSKNKNSIVESNLEEKSTEKNYTFNFDDFVNEKKKQIFSLIDIDENEEKKFDESELERIKKENIEIKNAFDLSVKKCQIKQQHLFEMRKLEDNVIRNKRKREDEELHSEHIEIFDRLGKLCQNLVSQRKKKEIPLKVDMEKKQ